jgi:hypothetical protein
MLSLEHPAKMRPRSANPAATYPRLAVMSLLAPLAGRSYHYLAFYHRGAKNASPWRMLCRADARGIQGSSRIQGVK